MLQLQCGEIFIIKHEEIAKDNFDTIESYFQKRFNKSTINNFVKNYLDYKIEYLTGIKNYKALKKETKYVLNRNKLNNGEISLGYASACLDFAEALRLNGDGKGYIKWIEKNISIRKKIYKKAKYPRLKVTYHNFVFKLIEIVPEDHDKILLYSKKALEYANSNEINYWKRLRGYAIALSHTGDFKDSINYFKKSLACLKNIDFENKELHVSNINLNLAITSAKVNLKKSIPMLENALEEANNPAVSSAIQFKESGVFQNWELIEIAKKILKNNKK